MVNCFKYIVRFWFQHLLFFFILTLLHYLITFSWTFFTISFMLCKYFNSTCFTMFNTVVPSLCLMLFFIGLPLLLSAFSSYRSSTFTTMSPFPRLNRRQRRELAGSQKAPIQSPVLRPVQSEQFVGEISLQTNLHDALSSRKVIPGYWPSNSGSMISPSHYSAANTLYSTSSPFDIDQSLSHSVSQRLGGGQALSQPILYPSTPSMDPYSVTHIPAYWHSTPSFSFFTTDPSFQKSVSQSLSHSAALQLEDQALSQPALNPSMLSMGSYDTFVNLPIYHTHLASGEIQNNNGTTFISPSNVDVTLLAADCDVEMTDAPDFSPMVIESPVANEPLNPFWTLNSTPMGLDMMIPVADVEMVDVMEWEPQAQGQYCPMDIDLCDPMDIDERDEMREDKMLVEPSQPCAKDSGHKFIAFTQHPTKPIPTMGNPPCPEPQGGAVSDAAMGGIESSAPILQRKSKLLSTF